MKFTFLTLFPSMFESYFEESILSRAKESKLIELNFLNPRDFSKNRHKKVDEYQVGGGAGLVMLPEPIDRA
ncbi:MAG: tRNA (guanine-N1)-methyltransferase, partial [Campylobacteraceae bacterium]|nr:tRNA (guanine-N1)-methyltransferase [Campylobacteraceae bacterium]